MTLYVKKEEYPLGRFIPVIIISFFLISAFFLNGVLLTTMSYVLEFNPVAYRGKVIACLCLCWPVGGILMAAVSYLSMKIFSWRAMLLTNSLPLLIPIIFVWFFPSSPHFLLTMGKKEEARRVLDFIITTNRVKRFDYDLIAPEMKTRTQFKELFNKKFGTTIAYLSILFFGQGIVYIGHVLIIVLLPLHPHTCLSTSGLHFYVPDLLVDDSCCQPPSDATFITIVVSSIGEIGSVIITYPLIDRVGRRKTLIVSGFLASGSFLLLAICSGNILINIFFAITRVTVSAFTITLLVYTLEVFPTSVRNLGVGFCEITSFSGSIVTSFVAEIFVPKGNGLSVVLFYAAVLFAMSSISCLLPYETAAKPLKDIADEPEYELSEYDQQSRNILQTAESHSMETKVYGTQ